MERGIKRRAVYVFVTGLRLVRLLSLNTFLKLRMLFDVFVCMLLLYFDVAKSAAYFKLG